MNERMKNSTPSNTLIQAYTSAEDAARMAFGDTHDRADLRPAPPPPPPKPRPEPAPFDYGPLPIWLRILNNDAAPGAVLLLIVVGIAFYFHRLS